ncbi:MAG TPA: 16S rRNA (guanine(966)-N(2))-methyltransferase RsmD, partial [bacterium]|nr:16S rRNA (guanine(966)-N(2))-methyltransferase RsmD [bacterium]
MRIIAGIRRGLVLNAFDEEIIRPTKDRVKESVFNILANIIDVTDTQILDLFAGTGNLGIEALSRGAAKSTFVELHSKAVHVLRNNVIKCRFEQQIDVITGDALEFISSVAVKKYDIVFADPPYAMRIGAMIAKKIDAGQWLNPGGVLVIE